jgi:flagellar protein FlaG
MAIDRLWFTISAVRPISMVRKVFEPVASGRFFPKELGMDVNALSRIAQAAPAVATPVSADAASQKRQVVQAVKALNQSEMLSEDNGLEFQKDPESNRWVVKVVNKTTGDVISQVPAEYVLRLADALKKI